MKKAARRKSSASTPLVGIIMGSESDLRVMSQAEEALKEFGVPFETRIISAHRTPVEMIEYAETASSRGIEVIIAGAGGAAHLPGMVASATTLPVIGVPVNITAYEGIDAFLSIVQMPKGVPVATVAIDNAFNAGLLAVRILGSTRLELSSKLSGFRTKQKKKVKATDRKVANSRRVRRS